VSWNVVMFQTSWCFKRHTPRRRYGRSKLLNLTQRFILCSYGLTYGFVYIKEPTSMFSLTRYSICCAYFLMYHFIATGCIIHLLSIVELSGTICTCPVTLSKLLNHIVLYCSTGILFSLLGWPSVDLPSVASDSLNLYVSISHGHEDFSHNFYMEK